MKTKTIERNPRPVQRAGRVVIQNVYVCRDSGGRVVDRWIYVLDQQMRVTPAPSGRGYIVELSQ